MTCEIFHAVRTKLANAALLSKINQTITHMLAQVKDFDSTSREVADEGAFSFSGVVSEEIS